MKLQAARADSWQQRIGRGRQKNQRGRFGWLLEYLEQQVGIGPAHGVGAIEDEDAAAALRLEIRRALHGTQLPHAQQGPRDRRAQAHWIGNHQPHVGMRLQDQRHAFDRGGVRAFAAFGEPGLDQRDRIGVSSHAQAGGALAAEVVLQALAIRSLREHARKRVFADAARASEKYRAWDAVATQHGAQRADDALVAEKFSERHPELFRRAAENGPVKRAVLCVEKRRCRLFVFYNLRGVFLGATCREGSGHLRCEIGC